MPIRKIFLFFIICLEKNWGRRADFFFTKTFLFFIICLEKNWGGRDFFTFYTQYLVV